jgi:hypothetical protein
VHDQALKGAPMEDWRSRAGSSTMPGAGNRSLFWKPEINSDLVRGFGVSSGRSSGKAQEMKNKIFYLTLLCSLGLVSLRAAPPSDQSIEQLLRVMQVDKLLDQMVGQMNSGMQSGMEKGLQQTLKGKTPTSAQQAQISDFQKKLSAVMKDELSYPKMKDVYLQVYRETFTQDEVNGIMAFYSSPAGQAMVQKTPGAMQKASALMQGRIGPMTQKLQSMMEQFEKDMEKTK